MINGPVEINEVGRKPPRMLVGYNWIRLMDKSSLSAASTIAHKARNLLKIDTMVVSRRITPELDPHFRVWPTPRVCAACGDPMSPRNSMLALSLRFLDLLKEGHFFTYFKDKTEGEGNFIWQHC